MSHTGDYKEFLKFLEEKTARETEQALRAGVFACSPTTKTTTVKLEGNKLFKNGEYFGEVITQDGNKLTVRCDNGNQFMKGNISTIYYYQE